MRRSSAAALLCLSASACLTAPPPRFPTADFAIPRSLRIHLIENGAAIIREIPLEDYVRATVLSEFAPAAGDLETVERMLEVQAILGRTYAVAHAARHAREGFDLCATTHCQLFEPDRLGTSRWAEAATKAVDRTAGVILRFNGAAAQALFHADCGGRTSRASAVWGGDDRAYLTSHADTDVPDQTHVRWEYRVGIDALTHALDADERTRTRGALDRLDVVRRDESGRAQDVEITSASKVRRSDRSIKRTTIRGDELRQILSRAFGARAIRSTWFDVRQDGPVFVFAGRGFGHGVGLCQAGALARIQSGSSVEEIINFYYPGTSLALARSH